MALKSAGKKRTAMAQIKENLQFIFSVIMIFSLGVAGDSYTCEEIRTVTVRIACYNHLGKKSRLYLT